MSKETERRFGIEIELEEVQIPDSIHTEWQAVSDGSLRNGVELITRGSGVPYEEAMSLLERLEPVLSSAHVTWRCGMHVHTNMRDLGRLGAMRFVLGYLTIEPLLFEWANTWSFYERNKSRFCEPLYGQSFSTMASRISAGEWNSFTKYTALNLRTLNTFGTVEMRLFQTPTTVDTCKEVVDVCNSLRLLAEDKEVKFAGLFELSPKKMVKRILGEEVGTSLLKHGGKDVEALINRGKDATLSLLLEI